jgi:hypothetical protein
MDADVKSLVKKITSDRQAMEILCKALASDDNFARAMVKQLRKAENLGA